MFIVIFSTLLKDHFVVPIEWIFEFNLAKHVNNGLNHNQPHSIYYTNKKEAYLDDDDGTPNTKWKPNFHSTSVPILTHLGNEYVTEGYLVKAYSKYIPCIYILFNLKSVN